jgi:hypothetical protein
MILLLALLFLVAVVIGSRTALAVLGSPTKA